MRIRVSKTAVLKIMMIASKAMISWKLQEVIMERRSTSSSLKNSSSRMG